MLQETPLAQLKQDVWDACMSETVPIIWGPPGVGKTEMVKSIGKDHRIPVYIIIGSLCDPTDINGFPVVSTTIKDASGEEHKSIEFAPRSFLREIQNKHDGRAIVFWDELTTTPPATQAAGLTTIQTKRFGDFQMDAKKLLFIAAANKTEHAANGQELALPMKNRLVHLDFPVNEMSAKEWAAQFPIYWGREPDVGMDGHEIAKDVMRRARTMVSGFIVRHPSLWFKMPKDPEGVNGYPTPRSWDAVSRFLGLAYHRNGYKTGSEFSIARLVSGAVGEAGVEFMTYVRESNIPDPEDVIRTAATWEPSDRSDINFVVLTGVVAAVQGRPTPDRLMAGLMVCNRVAARRGKSGVASYEASAIPAIRLAQLVNTDERLDKFAKDHKMSRDALAKLSIEAGKLLKPYLGMQTKMLEAVTS